MTFIILLLLGGPFNLGPNFDLMLISQRADFTWDWVGPEGGELLKIAVDPQNQNLAFAVSSFDLWRTTDGTQWSIIDQFTYKEIIAGATVGLNRALMATQDSIYLTIDGGNTWSPINYDFGTIHSITEEHSDTILVVGHVGSEYWIHYSFDSGNTFDSLVSLPFSYVTRIFSIAFDSDSTLFIGCQLYYAAVEDTAAIIRSTDLGQNWSTVLSKDDTLDFDEVADIELNPNNPQELFICFGMEGGPSGVFHTSNNGSNWITYGTDDDLFFPNDVEFLHTDSVVVASFFKPAIFRGRRTASDWTFNIVDSTYSCADIDGGIASTWFCGSVGGIRKSTNNGNAWFDATTGIKAFTVWPGFNNFTSPVNNMMYATSIMGNTFYSSSDGGETWRRKYDKNIFYRPAIVTSSSNPDTIYASGLYIDRILPDTIVYDFLISSDAGATWDTIHQIAHPESAVIFSSLHVSPSDQSLLLGRYLNNEMQDSEAVYLSTDQGSNWTIIMDDVDGPIVGSDTVFIYNQDLMLYSMDKGLTWDTLVNGIQVLNYDYDPDDQILYAIRPDSLVRIYLDGSVESLCPFSGMWPFLDVHGSDNLYITALILPNFIPVFMRSQDGGFTFDVDTLDFMPIGIAVTPDEVLLVDMGKGFRRSTDATGVSDNPYHSVTSQILVYPTVFKTCLMFEMKKPLTAHTRIYDVTGRLVDSFVINKKLTIWQNDIPAGVYFYEIDNTLIRGKVIKIE